MLRSTMMVTRSNPVPAIRMIALSEQNVCPSTRHGSLILPTPYVLTLPVLDAFVLYHACLWQ